MKKLDQTLTSSQLLNLRATPVQIIPAPGTGFVTIPFLIFMRLNAGSTAYGTLTTSLGLIINGTNVFPNQSMSTSFLGSTTDKFVYYVFTDSSLLNGGESVSSFENQPVYLQNTGLLELTSGNGTLDVQVQWDSFNV